jgi:pilus assembly protein CpaE
MAKLPILVMSQTKPGVIMREAFGSQESLGSSPRGRIIAVVSSKGGVGTTTAATNVAANLARGDRPVCLVDLVLRSGSVTSFLNVEPTFSLLDLVQCLRTPHPPALEDVLVRHVSGVRVLAEPVQDDREPRIKPADIDEVFDRLAQFFDFVVVDTPKDFDDMQLLVLDRAEVVLFLTEMDVPSLQSARRAFCHFHRMGVDTTKIRVLLNRYVEIKIMDLKAVEKVLGKEVFWTLPNNYPVVVSAVNRGLPIQACEGSSDIAMSYDGLLQALLRDLQFPV